MAPAGLPPRAPPAGGDSPCVAVAASGGRDSTALLHATVRQAHQLGLSVVALHVHHGLQAQADAWARHLQHQCRRWAAAGWPVRCVVHRLATHPAPGDSLEAWAHRERHQALHNLARQAGATLLLLAHHREDQAETFLLQALRGQGAAGLAAMPARQWREGLCWARPWLDQSRVSIEAYLTRWRLSHIDDGSNLDPRFDRNRLRHSVWPPLKDAFAGAAAQLGRSARLIAVAAEVQQEMAQLDWQACADGAQGMDRSRWLALSPARRRGALRAWIAATVGALTERVLDRLCEDLPQAPSGCRWDLGQGWQLRHHRHRLSLVRPAPTRGKAMPAAGSEPWPLRLPHDPGVLDAGPWPGQLRMVAVPAGGVTLAKLQAQGPLSLRARQGSEQWRGHLDRPARSLKKQFQALGLPATERAGPLLWCGEQLVWVPGLGLQADWRCPDHRPGQVDFRWEPSGASG